MKRKDKLLVLGESAQWDLCCTNACVGGTHGPGGVRGAAGRWVYPAALPDGRTVNLFKVLMSNDCRNDCAYCSARCSAKHQRETFEPEELARVFLDLHRRRIAQGMFLSSGIHRDSDTTMDRMLAVGELLRGKHGFTGFLHMKVLPGASFDRAERAAELADRISINLEAPNRRALSQVCPDKDFDTDLMRRMEWIGKFVGRSDTRAKAHTTQFVIGAADESDRDVLSTVTRLYDRLNLQRAYYSAFQPLAQSPLSDKPASPLLREHRLYQCDYLFRRYGFGMDEVLFDEDGLLPLDTNPKQLWADAHPECFPVEVNTAPRATLLRVPGIGPKAAGRIIRMRRKAKLHSLDDLRATGCVTKWAAPYVTINGKLGAPMPAKQMVLW